MASIWRYRMRLSGWAGGPGVSTLYASDVAGTPQDHANAVAGLFSDVYTPAGVLDLLPQGIKIVGDPFVDVIDPATGDQTGTVAVTPVGTLSGVATAGWSDVSGLSITWITAAFIAGRRVKGRTYFVPMGGGAYDTDGTLKTSVLTSVQGAATQYLAKISEPVVW